MEFVPINTQEEFDEAIKKRLAQQERKHQDAIAALESQHKTEVNSLTASHKKELDSIRSKIKAQDENEEKITAYEKQIADLGDELKKAQESIAGNAKEIADRDAKIRAYEIDSVKTRIVHEMKLPYDSIGFLKGEDEEGIRKSAEALKGLVGSRVMPLASGEPQGISGGDNAHAASMRNMLHGLNLKGE